MFNYVAVNVTSAAATEASWTVSEVEGSKSSLGELGLTVFWTGEAIFEIVSVGELEIVAVPKAVMDFVTTYVT